MFHNYCTTAWEKYLPVFDTMKLTILANPLRPGGHFPQIKKQDLGRMFLLLAACGLVLAGCSGPVPTPTLAPTATVTETPTATIVWFPPTDTPTALPPQSAPPTQENRPGLGELLFSDQFDQPALWNTARSDQASAILANSRLVLSITEPGPLYITSLRSQPIATDFYAEATATLSLCSSNDQYGMLFRAASSMDYYRFVLTCNSQERLERVRAGVTYPLLAWLSSNDIPLGAPAQVKLGVWADGREIRLFVNDAYQFSMVDPVFPAGTFGFFAYASGKNPITVSFSDLSVHSISFILPSPSPMPSWTPAKASKP
jgi:hypothetical protein